MTYDSNSGSTCIPISGMKSNRLLVTPKRTCFPMILRSRSAILRIDTENMDNHSFQPGLTLVPISRSTSALKQSLNDKHIKTQRKTDPDDQAFHFTLRVVRSIYPKIESGVTI